MRFLACAPSMKPPISRFSATLMVPNTLRSCGTKDRPCRLIAGAPRPAISCSLKRTLPPLGRSRPATSFSSVDLPAPLGPMRATISPASTLRSAPFTISSAAA